MSRVQNLQMASGVLLLPWRQLLLYLTPALLLLLVLHLPVLSPVCRNINSSGSSSGSGRSDTLPVLESMHGSTFIWQLPQQPPRAVLFIAHGCTCRPTFFWDKSPSCPDCIGLPEDRPYVLEALRSRYAVIAIASASTCWNRSTDTPKVVSILQAWIRRQRLDGLPVFALGASSGGYFVSTLALRVRFNATVLMISEGHFEAMDLGKDYPPTLFVHMPRDERRAVGVARAIEVLRKNGVDAGELKCEGFPVTPLLLSERIPGMGEELARKVYEGLKKGGILDENDFMIGDGRSVGWRAVVERKNGFSPGLQAWEHHIQEELNAAYAYHEMTSVPLNRIFEWFATHGG